MSKSITKSLVAAAMTCAMAFQATAADSIKIVDRPMDGENSNYVNFRAPL